MWISLKNSIWERNTKGTRNKAADETDYTDEAEPSALSALSAALFALFAARILVAALPRFGIHKAPSTQSEGKLWLFF
jgi:hypothetical protein